MYTHWGTAINRSISTSHIVSTSRLQPFCVDCVYDFTRKQMRNLGIREYGIITDLHFEVCKVCDFPETATYDTIDIVNGYPVIVKETRRLPREHDHESGRDRSLACCY